MMAQIVMKYHPRVRGEGNGRVLMYFQRGKSNPSVPFTRPLAAGAEGVSAAQECDPAWCFGPWLHTA